MTSKMAGRGHCRRLLRGTIPVLILGAALSACSVALKTGEVSDYAAVTEPTIAERADDLSRVPWGREPSQGGFGRLANILINGRGEENAGGREADAEVAVYTEYLEREFPTVDEQLAAVAEEVKRRREQVDYIHRTLLAEVGDEGGVRPMAGDDAQSLLDRLSSAVQSMGRQLPVLRVTAQQLMARLNGAPAVNPETDLAQLEEALYRLEDLRNQISAAQDV